MSEHTIPTVRVQNPSDPDSFMVINESDLRPHHRLWDEVDHGDDQPKVKAQEDPFSITRGGRGRHYVRDNKTAQIVSKGFVTHEEAEAERTKLQTQG